MKVDWKTMKNGFPEVYAQKTNPPQSNGKSYVSATVANIPFVQGVYCAAISFPSEEVNCL